MDLASRLTPEQLEKFREVNRRLGLPEDTVTDHTPTSRLQAKSGKASKVIFSSDPAQSHFKPILLTAHNMEDLQRMVGSPDPQSKSQLKELKSTDVSGAEPETLANDTMRFPKTVAYFASHNLDIDAPTEVSGPHPVIWNYNTINIGENGSLRVTTQMNITADTLTSVGDDRTITVIGSDPPPKPPNGASGNQGGQGPYGPAAQCGPNSSIPGTPIVCYAAPGNGGQGGPGGPGGPGIPAISGSMQPIFNLVIDSLSGNLIIEGGGGNGQSGGDGGPGGPGGPGGFAGQNCGPCPSANDGPPGFGGRGGDGGPAGDGGDGTLINIYLNNGATGNIGVRYIGGQPGSPGQGGDGGSGSGNAGPGNPGAVGKPGRPSKIIIGPMPV